MRALLPRLLLAALLAGPLACGKSGRSGGGSVPAPDPSTVLTRGPFLGEVTTTGITVAWSTAGPGVGEVEYRGSDGTVRVAVEGAAAAAHAVRVEGLEPGATYRYSIRTAGATVASDGSFAAARTPSDPRLRFAALGDSGDGSAAQLAVADRIADADPELVVHSGDVIYPAGESENFDPVFFEPYEALLSHVPFYTCLGNHDVLTQGGAPYLEAFHLPHDNPESSERYYSFDAANVHFVSLDSNGSFAPGSPMAVWLAADLATSAADWKVVFFHHPLFSSGLHGSTLGLRAELLPLLEAGGVDLVINGHDHVYERTYPLQGGIPVNISQEPNYLDPGGPMFVVTGGGGKDLYQKTADNPFTAFFQSSFHTVVVEVAGRSLELRAVRSDGVVIDAATITKSP